VVLESIPQNMNLSKKLKLVRKLTTNLNAWLCTINVTSAKGVSLLRKFKWITSFLWYALRKDSSRGIYLLHASFVHQIIYKYSAKVVMTPKQKQRG
jgi:hypothetical protein